MAEEPKERQAEANALDLELVLIDDLVLDTKNARKGSIPDIAHSLKTLGQHRPIVVRRDTKEIVAGNHTVQAAKTLGWTKINVVWVDDDEATATMRSLADNFTSDKSTWDDDVLKELLISLGEDVVVPGLDDKTLAKLMADPDEDKGIDPALPIVPRMGEEYDYVLVVATNDVDAGWLRENFGVRTEVSYKSEKVGKTRVVTVARLQEEWRTNGAPK